MGVRSGDGGPAESWKISLMMAVRTSSFSDAALGEGEGLLGDTLANSRAVASINAVSRPSLRPSVKLNGSARNVRAAYDGIRSFLSSSCV